MSTANLVMSNTEDDDSRLIRQILSAELDVNQMLAFSRVGYSLHSEKGNATQPLNGGIISRVAQTGSGVSEI